jgi:hypothetical protein
MAVLLPRRLPPPAAGTRLTTVSRPKQSAPSCAETSPGPNAWAVLWVDILRRPVWRGGYRCHDRCPPPRPVGWCLSAVILGSSPARRFRHAREPSARAL